jgi:hypothetical protein
MASVKRQIWQSKKAISNTNEVSGGMVLVSEFKHETETPEAGIPDAPDDASAYVRSGLAWVVGYTKAAIDSLLGGKENTITATTAADYYRGDKTFQPLNKSAVGLGNVDNTSDVNKPISSATQTALDNQNFFRTDKSFIKFFAINNSFATLGLATGVSFTGGGTTRTLTNTNNYTRKFRLGLDTTATAGNVVQYRNALAHFFPDNLDYFEQTIGSATGSATSGMRAVFGIFPNLGALTSNIEYDTLTDLIGICRLSSSDNWHIIHNDSAGTATTIDLGSNFLATNDSNNDSEITFRITPLTATSCLMEVTNASGLKDTRTLSTDLPDFDQLFTVKGSINNNANATVYGIDMFAILELFK